MTIYIEKLIKLSLGQIVKGIMFLAIIVTTLFVCGCSDEKPVIAQAATGDGYKIELKVNPGEIRDGGSVSIEAVITDPQGLPVPDEDKGVIFSCAQGGFDFEDQQCDIKSGSARTFATWKDESDSDDPLSSMTTYITANYKGAYASCQVTLISKAF